MDTYKKWNQNGKTEKRMRKGEKPRDPLYTAEEAAKCLQIFEAVQYDNIIDITDKIHVRFNDAGHMLGSSIIELWVDEEGKTTKQYLLEHRK